MSDDLTGKKREVAYAKIAEVFGGREYQTQEIPPVEDECTATIIARDVRPGVPFWDESGTELVGISY